ncbi:MAG: response regulator transcription factor [Clostridia bacterium]|nr:response regulator transcription factor [Clostridia bacterium]
MYRIAIIEDQAGDANLLTAALEKYGQEKQTGFQCDWHRTAEGFLDQYHYQYDIVFMDIRLPGITGMKAAHKLRSKDHAVLLVFTTNLAQYAVEGYEVDAADYILKPVTYAALKLKLPKLLRKCGNDGREILVKCDEKFIKLHPSELMYTEIYDHHIHYVTQACTFRAYGTLKEIEDKLPDGFFRVNNQTIVNLRYVTSAGDTDVVVGGRSFPISFRRRKDFLAALHDTGKSV